MGLVVYLLGCSGALGITPRLTSHLTGLLQAMGWAVVVIGYLPYLFPNGRHVTLTYALSLPRSPSSM